MTMTITQYGQSRVVTELECVRAYFAEHDDLALFDDIIRSHRGPEWFEHGLQLGYPLSVIWAIAKNQEAVAKAS
jgi:hypothetical protein